jgi:toxin-antitoxin system PIN domain toxin
VNLYDVNVRMYAPVATRRITRPRAWFERELSGPGPFMMSELVLSGFVRVVTNPKVFAVPTPLDVALGEAEQILRNPLCLPVNPGRRPFDLFPKLCRDGDARGNLAADAYLAALAIENGCRWYTFDRDFTRFPGLDWGSPTYPRQQGRREYVRTPRARRRPPPSAPSRAPSRPACTAGSTGLPRPSAPPSAGTRWTAACSRSAAAAGIGSRCCTGMGPRRLSPAGASGWSRGGSGSRRRRPGRRPSTSGPASWPCSWRGPTSGPSGEPVDQALDVQAGGLLERVVLAHQWPHRDLVQFGVEHVPRGGRSSAARSRDRRPRPAGRPRTPAGASVPIRAKRLPVPRRGRPRPVPPEPEGRRGTRLRIASPA